VGRQRAVELWRRLDYVYIAEQRISDAEQGKLRTRPITRPVINHGKIFLETTLVWLFRFWLYASIIMLKGVA
jgi:hypothetical protein